MKTKITVKRIILILLIVASGELVAQNNLSFYHMGKGIPQGSNYNPAYFPDARVFVSLPGISGIDLSVNNSFSISDIFTQTGDSTLIDVGRFLGTQQKKRSFLNVDLDVTDLMIGFRVGEKMHFSLFVNDKFDFTFFYPIDLMNFVWRGNAAYVGQNFVADQMGYSTTHYREYGIGYGQTFTILDRETTIGARFKYLNGMLHNSTQNFSVSILTDEADYSLTASFNEAQIRSVAFSQLTDDDAEDFDESYFIFNENAGFGLDLGARMQFSDKLGLGAAVNDLGFINWKQHAELINFKGTSFTYSGIDLDDTDSFGQAIEDSLKNLEPDTVAGTFTTKLNARTYFSADYQVTPKGQAQATIANYMTQGRVKTSIGLGYTQQVGRWFTASATGSYVPQQGVDLGLGMMFRLSTFQLYVAADNIFNTIDVPNASAANINFGINFLFGRAEKKSKKKVTPPVTPTPPDAEPTEETMKVTPAVEPEEEEDYSDYEHLWKKRK